MASFNILPAKNIDFNEYWKQESKAELYHFYQAKTSSIFMPCSGRHCYLHNSGFRNNRRKFLHMVLTVDGKKMSKSRGTFIRAQSYLKHLQPEYFALLLCRQTQ